MSKEVLSLEEKKTEFQNQLKVYNIDLNELQANQSINQSTFVALNLPTPTKFVKERPGKGGGTWKYVEGAYVIDRLNMVFGLAWGFEVEAQWSEQGYAMVRGHLVINLLDGRTVKRPGSGSHEITLRKDGKTLLDLGNDYKAAETDALKRAARTLGIALDLYSDELATERRLLAAMARQKPEEVANEKEARRVNQHIYNSKTIEDLMLVSHLAGKYGFEEMFKDKYEELSTN